MSLVAALEALRRGRPVRLVDDRDAAGASALVLDAACGGPGLPVPRAGRAPLRLAVEPSRLARFPTAVLSRLAPSRIGLRGEPDPAAAARAVLDPGVGVAAFEPGGALEVAPVGPGGVLGLRSLPAGALDLVRLAGGEAALLLEVSGAADAEVALTEVAARREAQEVLVEEAASAHLPSRYTGAGLRARAFVSLFDGVEHLALVRGEPLPGALVRVHSECLTGDALGSLRCDCGEQLRAALARISAAPSGALIYLRGHEGRGIGLANKMRAYALQDEGLDTAEANRALGFPDDAREYAVAAQILKQLGMADVRLLSNNPRKGRALAAYGIRVREELPLVLGSNPHNHAYLAAKRDKLGHRLPGPGGGSPVLAGEP